jgi:hypothetical protein
MISEYALALRSLFPSGRRMHRLTVWNLALSGAVVLLTVALVVLAALTLF